MVVTKVCIVVEISIQNGGSYTAIHLKRSWAFSENIDSIAQHPAVSAVEKSASQTDPPMYSR